MKQRFSSLDIKVIAHELSTSIVSLRAVNIYDLSSRIFLFKFQKPGHKVQFIIDSGFRCHLTSFARTTAPTPSAFVQRLRKFLKDRRVTSVAQVGTDRILELQFSEGRYRLFLEFYAGGNIILTDNELKVLALLRQVNEGAEHELIRLGGTYNLSERQNINGIDPLTEERIRNGLQAWLDKQASGKASSNKKLKKKAGDTLRKALASVITEYPPMLIDHSLRSKGFNIELQPEDVLKDEALVKSLVDAVLEAGRTMDTVMSADVAKGYIFGKPNTKGVPEADEKDAAAEGRSSVLYNDYHPFKPKHLLDDSETRIIEMEGFNKTVDEFYSSIEGQKLESRLAEKEEHARKKIENARTDQAKRLGGLQEVRDLNERKASAIEANVPRVEEATAAINGLIAQGKDWDEIDKLIQLEKRRSNPVAEIIKLPLKLNENTATLLLGEWGEEEEIDDGYDSSASEPSDSEDETSKQSKSKAKGAPADKRLAVDIDLAMTPWANARQYHDQKKTAAAKSEKTLQASTKALKSTERKVQADLSKALKQEKQVLRPVRQPFWFEKFIYFLSSDGYLIVGGRDAQQCEILYRRHLKKGDVYVHAELDGSTPTIVKNRLGAADAPIPPSTLSQAGNMSITTSTAWDSKAVMSAWWVNAEQLSKKASTGDILGPGKFAVKGEKTFLPPAQLLLGFAVLFQISEDSKARHFKHRVQDAESAKERNAQTAQEDQEGTVPEDNDDDDGDEHDEDDEDEDDAHDDTADEDEASRANPLQGGRDDEDDDNDEDGLDTHEDNKAQPSAETDAAVVNGDDGEDEADDDQNDEEDEEDEDDTTAAAETASTAPSSTSKPKTVIPVRGKKGKKKKMAKKYADQDEEDRAEAMRLLGSVAGQQKATDEAQTKAEREKEAAAARQRRREQHEKRDREAAAHDIAEGGGDEQEDSTITDVDLERLVGTPLPGDELLEALPVCAPWNALGRYKYKVKLQPGSVKKGKAVREILGRWGAAAANKRNVDEKAEDVERIWPREMELVKAWKDAEVFGAVPVGKVRVMMSGGAGGAGSKDSKSKGGKPQKGRSGKGSKKQR